MISQIKISDKSFILISLLFYAAFVVIISSLHVVWRDEVTPMTAIMGSSSLADLYVKTHSFGHPILWFFLLYLGYQVTHAFWCLKAINILIVVGAVYLFLAKAPFSRSQKILFILGFFPLYFYPVFNRSYGLGMLLLFAFAWLYPYRFKRMFLLGVILLLLANTHAHCLITTVAILLALIVEFVFNPESRRSWQAHSFSTFLGFALIIIGIMFSAFQTMPSHNNIIYSPHLISVKEFFHALIKSVFLPGKAFNHIFGFYSTLFATVVIFYMYIYLLNKPYLFVLFASATVALSLFCHLIFPSDELRHQGALYLLLITLWWTEVHVSPIRLNKTLEKFRNSIVRHQEAFLIVLLFLQVCMAYPAVRDELSAPYSSSQNLGKMLHRQEFENAVLIGEPGAMVEAVPYYANNEIYLPREGKYKKFTEFTTRQKLQYSLGDLLSAAQQVKIHTGKTVLLVLGHKLWPEGPFYIEMTHGRSFVYTKASLDDLYAKTTRVTEFRGASSDENYDVFLLK